MAAALRAAFLDRVAFVLPPGGLALLVNFAPEIAVAALAARELAAGVS